MRVKFRMAANKHVHVERLKQTPAGSMTDLFAGLTAAGFPAGPDRLNEVMLALKAADFEWLEDLQDAEGCGGVPSPFPC